MAPDYSSIGIEREHLDRLRAVKRRWEDLAANKFRWGDFLMLLVSLQESQEPVQHVVMGQDLNKEPEEGAPAWEKDDAMTLEVAAMVGGAASLSEGSIEAIAERVVEKLMERFPDLLGNTEKHEKS